MKTWRNVFIQLDFSMSKVIAQIIFKFIFGGNNFLNEVLLSSETNLW